MMADMDSENTPVSPSSEDGPGPGNHDGLPVDVTLEGGGTEVRPTADRLARLVGLVGAPSCRWITVSPADAPDAGVFIQAWRVGDGDYDVETGDGTPSMIVSRPVPREEIADAFVGWATRLADAGNAAGERAAPEPDAEVLEDAEGFARLVVCRGEARLEEAVREVTEHVGDRLPTARARRIVQDVWDEILRDQRTATGPADCDCLDEVFRELRKSGIEALQDYSCCRTCALDGIAPSGDRDRGFVFYHGQDTDRAIGGGGLMLSYGAFGGDEEATAAIGREVVGLIEEAGLTAHWDGAPGTRIEISPMEWRRRLPG